MAMPVFVDDGSTAIKVYSGDMMHPVIVSSGMRRGRSIALSSSSAADICVEGEWYTAAPFDVAVAYSADVSWQYSRACVAAVHHAMRAADIPAGDVSLTVTLPVMEYYSPDGEVRTDSVERKRVAMMRCVDIGGRAAYRVTDVSVLPESAPALVGWLDSAGVQEWEQTLVVDTGGTTTDCAIIIGAYADISRVWGESAGTSLVTERVMSELTTIGFTSSRGAAEAIIQRHADAGWMRSTLGEHADIINHAVRDGVALLSQRVCALISRAGTPGRVCLVGGGAALIERDVRAHLEKAATSVIVVEQPQTALVRAMRVMGASSESREE